MIINIEAAEFLIIKISRSVYKNLIEILNEYDWDKYWG